MDHAIPVRSLTDQPRRFEVVPDAETLSRLASDLGLDALRKVRLSGSVAPEGADYILTGTLGATVVQPCVVTLEPVTTRIDTPVLRRYVARWHEPESEEVEMDPDDSREPLGHLIDPAAVLVEALALAIPLYPRSETTVAGDMIHGPPGVDPMTDEEAKPLAGLAALRDKLDGSG